MPTELADDDSPVLTDQVVTKLEHLIVSGHYRPGEKVREQLLAEELGVSRGPLREAIRTLEGRRLLTRTPRSGVEVIGLSVDDLRQLWVTREALEGMAARQAAENMTVAEVNALRETLAMLEKRPQHAPVTIFGGGHEHDNDFHRLVAQGSRNRWLSDILIKDLYSMLRMYRVLACGRPDITDSLAEHHSIIDRIHARDAYGAEKEMRAHLQRTRDRTLQLFQK
jgi:DNA-binding GntR family transcriptional regulator